MIYKTRMLFSIEKLTINNSLDDYWYLDNNAKAQALSNISTALSIYS